MAAAFRSSNLTAYASRTNLTVTAPAGIQDGDMLLFFCLVGQSSPTTASPPAGFTVITGFPVLVTQSGGGFNVRNYCWYKVASSESGNYTATLNAFSEGYMVAVSGASGTAPTATTNTGTGTTTTALSITPSADQSFVMFVSQDWGDSTNALTAPTGSTPTFTKRVSGSATSIMMVADGILSPAGATGNKTATNNSNSSDPWSGYLIKVEAAGATGKLFQPPLLHGLGAGGPFFRNPLG